MNDSGSLLGEVKGSSRFGAATKVAGSDVDSSAGRAERPRSLNLLVLCKRRYTARDLIGERFGRLYHFPVELALRGHRVTVLCLDYPWRRSAHRGPDEDGVSWHSVAFPFSGLAFKQRAVRLAHETNADLILGMADSIYAIWARAVARKVGCRFACDLYDNFESFSNMKWPGIRAAYEQAVNEAEFVSCVSQRLRQYVIETYSPEGPVLTVPNAVDTGKFRPLDKEACRRQLDLPPGVPLIGYFGALHPNRGIENLFRGLDLVRQQRPDAWLVMAGKVDRRISLPGRNQQVRYLGSLPHAEMPVCINACDVVTVFNEDSSFGRYCFPQKLCEYMACGVPVVATDVGAVHDLLGSTSPYVYPPGQLDLFADRVLNLFDDPAVDYGSIPSWSDAVEPFCRSLAQRC